jgi:hypothetical protein
MGVGRRSLHGRAKMCSLTIDMGSMVRGALLVLVPLAGCGGVTHSPRADAPASRLQAREIVYLYRVQGDDPMPDSISLRADGTADIRRGGGGAGIKWVKTALDRNEMARVTRLVERAPWRALDGTTVKPGGFGGWDNDMRYMVRRGPRSITVTGAQLPRGIRPLIRELEAIIEDDTGQRLSSVVASRVSATVDP